MCIRDRCWRWCAAIIRSTKSSWARWPDWPTTAWPPKPKSWSLSLIHIYRRIDNRGEPVPQDVAAGKSVESPQCISARLNLSLLAGKSALQQDTDGDGKPDKVLGEEDRANQRNLADAAVKAYCPPAATAGR